MMTSPEEYSIEIKGYSVEKLNNERTKFKQYVNRVENDQVDEYEKASKPSPEVIAETYLEYISALEEQLESLKQD